MKRCSKCGEWKTFEDFRRNSYSGDGRRSDCKSCQSAYCQTWFENNPTYVRDYARGFRKTQPTVMVRDGVSYKRCPQCGEWKVFAEFGANKRTKTGRESWCLICSRKRISEWGFRNRKTVSERKRAKRKPKRIPIHRLENDVKQKRCYKCREWKGLEEFHVSTRSADGRQASCKSCQSLIARNFADKHRERLNWRYADALLENPNLTKVCTGCGREKTHTEFSRGAGKYGLQPKCKECQSAERSAYWFAHKEQIMEQKRLRLGIKKRESCRKTEGGIELKKCSSCKRWQTLDNFRPNARRWDGLDNRCVFCDKIRKHQRRVHRFQLCMKRSTDGKYVLDQRKLALLEGRIDNQNRRAEAYSVAGRLTGRQFIELCEHFGFRCIHPGHWAVLPLEQLTPDHVVPIAKGGGNTIADIQPLCAYHNRKKNARIIDYRPLAEQRLAAEQLS